MVKSVSVDCIYTAYVDDCDYEEISRHYWGADITGDKVYARRAIKLDGKQKTIFMHHAIIGKPDKGYVVDHINGDGLDNTRANLRICTYSQNAINRDKSEYGPYGKCSSKHKGVSWFKDQKKWIAVIHCNKKRYFLGAFKDEIAAALAYNESAKCLFGEYAVLNQI